MGSERTAAQATTYIVEVASEKALWGFASAEKPTEALESCWLRSGEEWLPRKPNFRTPLEAAEPHFCFVPANCVPLFAAFSGRAYAPPSFAAEKLPSEQFSVEPFNALLRHVERFYDARYPLSDARALFIEPSHRSDLGKKHFMCEVFASHDVASFFSLRRAPAVALAVARPTALVAEIDGASLSLSPVFEAYNLMHFATRHHFGAQFFDAAYAAHANLFSLEEERWREFSPYFAADALAAGAAPTPRYATASKAKLAADMRAVHLSFGERAAANELDEEKKLYELPDGQALAAPDELTAQLASFFLAGAKDQQFSSAVLERSPSLAPICANWRGLATEIFDAVFRCDPESANALASNILCVGAVASAPHFHARLSAEMSKIVTLNSAAFDQNSPAAKTRYIASQKNKVYSLAPTEVHATAWQGGNAIASVSGFEKYWITREEFQEHGESILDRKITF